MAFSNQYGGVPHINPSNTGAQMMLEALNSASARPTKNYFSLVGDLGKIGAQFWQDYNDDDARQAMMQYTDSKELQNAIASGKLDLSKTSTKFQKEASDQISNLANTKLSQVSAEKSQFEYDRDKRFEDGMVEATPIINEVQRLMSTGSPADLQKAMELSLQLKDPRILKELNINPREEFRAQRALDLDQQRVGIEANRANLEAKRLGLEVKREELAQAMDLAKKYEAQGITPMTGDGATILKQALGPYYNMLYPMGYAEGGEDAAKDIGVTSSTYSQAARKELELARQKLATVADSNQYTKSFDSLSEDDKALLDRNIKGDDFIGLSKLVIKNSLGLSEDEMRPAEVAEFAEKVQKDYRKIKKEHPEVSLRDVAAVMLNSNDAFQKNADLIGGRLPGSNYHDFNSGFSGLGFVYDPQRFKEELLTSSRSNSLSSKVDDYKSALDALDTELNSVDMRAAQDKAIAGHSGQVDAKRKAQMVAKYSEQRAKIIEEKKKLENELEKLTGRKLSR